jgi:hypothetical protein
MANLWSETVVGRVLYRLQQFWHGLTAEPLPGAAHAEIAAVLNDREFELFRRFSAGDQRHSYRVFCTLRAANHTHPELLTAALLHDVGKTRAPLSVWERSLAVLAQAFLPGKVAAWGQGKAQGWRRPFVVKAQHPTWSAEMVRAAGSGPLTVSLVRRHQEELSEVAMTEEDRLLQHLQWADNQN